MGRAVPCPRTARRIGFEVPGLLRQLGQPGKGGGVASVGGLAVGGLGPVEGETRRDRCIRRALVAPSWALVLPVAPPREGWAFHPSAVEMTMDM